jgi:phosphoesterase RecJ-like protein
LEYVAKAESICILGHTHPDGDCIGAGLALYNYLSDMRPRLRLEIFLDQAVTKFAYLKNFEKIRTDYAQEEPFDLCVCLDGADKGRMTKFHPYFDQAKATVCVDHHVTNEGYAQLNIIRPDAASTCQILFGLLEEENITKEIAECLYTGIVHDTGVFKYSNTTAETMNVAGRLMEKGIDFTSIIDDSYYRKTYIQNQILGRALLESILFLKKQCIFTVIRKKDMDFYEANSQDLDGIVDQLRNTAGVECAIFMYETGAHEFKVSLRSNKVVDVSKIAAYYGGGGHVRAAGCSIAGSIYDVVNNLAKEIEKQMGEKH